MNSRKIAAEYPAKNSEGNLKRPPGVSQLYYPQIMNKLPFTVHLDIHCVPESGAVIRVPAFDGMFRGQVISLYWVGTTTYTTNTAVPAIGRYIDMIVPRDVVRESVPIDDNGKTVVSLYYEVRLLDGNIERSPPMRFDIYNDLVPNAPPTVPDAPNGEFDPHSIAEPGLKVVFPTERTLMGMQCTTYGRDGQMITTSRYALGFDEEFIHIPRVVLDQTEPGGDMWLCYTGRGEDGYLIESLFAVLRVIGQ